MTKRLLLAAVGLVLAGAAGAQGPAPTAAPAAALATPPGYHKHDGFYLQLGLGGGALSSKASAGGLDLELSGGGAVFNVALGVAVSQDFLIGGRVFSASVASPTVKLNGTDLGNAEGNYGLVGYGLDLTYYFSPSNFYVSGSPAMTRLTSDDGSGNSSASDWGFGFRLAVGKEWWVSENWGLGLDLEYAYSSNQDAVRARPPSAPTGSARPSPPPSTSQQRRTGMLMVGCVWAGACLHVR